MNNYSLWDVIKNIVRFIWGRTHNINQFANFYYTLNKRQIFLLLSLLFLFFSFLFLFFSLLFLLLFFLLFICQSYGKFRNGISLHNGKFYQVRKEEVLRTSATHFIRRVFSRYMIVMEGGGEVYHKILVCMYCIKLKLGQWKLSNSRSKKHHNSRMLIWFNFICQVFVSSINFNKNERNSFFSVKYCQLIVSDIELMIIYGLKGESKFRLRSIKILVIKLCKQGQNSMRDFLVALEILKVFIITMLLMSQKQLLATVISFDGIVLKNFLLTVSTVLLLERSNHVRGFALFRQLQSYFLEIIFRDNNLFYEMLSTITFVRYFLFPKR